MGFGSSGQSFGYAMGVDPFLQKGMSQAKGSGGLGRSVLNILGGSEGDSSKYLGKSIAEKGMGSAENEGGLGKRVIPAFIKSMVGGGLGAVGGISELGSLSSTLGELGAIGKTAANVVDTIGGVVDSIASPVLEAVSPVTDVIGGVQDTISGFADNILPSEGIAGEVVGSFREGGPVQVLKDTVSDLTGLDVPIGPKDMIGMAGEKLGLSPEMTETLQAMQGAKDPNKRVMSSAPPLSVLADEERRKRLASAAELGARSGSAQSSTRKRESRAKAQADRQGAMMRSLVESRMGAESPLLTHLGGYIDGGQRRIPGEDEGRDNQTVLMNVGGGETITVTPAGEKPPPNPNPSQGQSSLDYISFPGTTDASGASSVQGQLAGLGGDVGGVDYEGPHRFVGGKAVPVSSDVMSASVGDLHTPISEEPSTLDKILAGVGLVAGKFQGAPYGERASSRTDREKVDRYREALQAFHTQLAYEGREPTPQEKRMEFAMGIGLGDRKDSILAPPQHRTSVREGATPGTQDTVLEEWKNGRWNEISVVSSHTDKAPRKVYHSDGARFTNMVRDPATGKFVFYGIDGELLPDNTTEDDKRIAWTPDRSVGTAKRTHARQGAKSEKLVGIYEQAARVLNIGKDSSGKYILASGSALEEAIRNANTLSKQDRASWKRIVDTVMDPAHALDPSYATADDIALQQYLINIVNELEVKPQS